MVFLGVAMPTFPPVDDQLAVLLRGAAHVEKRDELRRKLEKCVAAGTPLRVKYGIDPTGFDVHLGHTVPLRKLRQFQQLGHTAVLIIGTATAQVGDPSGRDEARKGLTPDQIEQNAKSYLTQIAKVVDVSKAEVRPNGDWFGKWGFADVLKLLGKATVQQMLMREDFAKRFDELKLPIYLHECLYPLMQGWDSVEVKSDVELGGTEQLFNLMVGRDLQRDAGQEPQVCLTMPILRGTDGAKKMGKSVGNYIGLNEPAKDQFGKTMSIPDTLLAEWFELLTDRPTDEVAALVANQPLEAKKTLAAAVVGAYHGDAAAAAARRDWDTRSKGGDPDAIDEVTIPAAELQGGQVGVLRLMVLAGLCESNNVARRKVQEGAFNYGPDRAKPADFKAAVAVADGMVLRLGKKMKRVRLSQ
jgi:tyrosyl-tRNA synthetase